MKMLKIPGKVCKNRISLYRCVCLLRFVLFLGDVNARLFRPDASLVSLFFSNIVIVMKGCINTLVEKTSKLEGTLKNLGPGSPTSGPAKISCQFKEPQRS
jgi:hypothetical protein